MERDLRRVNEELAKANRAKSTFLSMVSHELRTPLSVVRGYLSLILEGKIGPDPERILDALRVADKRARHLQHLIEELLDLSRIESGRLSLHKEPIAVGKHVREVVEMFRGDQDRRKLADRHRDPRHAARRAGGPRQDPPDFHELPVERREIHRRRRADRRARPRRRVDARVRGLRHRHRHPRRQDLPGFRQVLPGRLLRQADVPGHRPRPGDRENDRHRARRHGAGRQPGGRGVGVHLHAPAGREPPPPHRRRPPASPAAPPAAAGAARRRPGPHPRAHHRRRPRHPHDDQAAAARVALRGRRGLRRVRRDCASSTSASPTSSSSTRSCR